MERYRGRESPVKKDEGEDGLRLIERYSGRERDREGGMRQMEAVRDRDRDKELQMEGDCCRWK